MMLIVFRTLLLAIALLPAGLAWAQFDHGHKAWDALLRKHVLLAPGANASSVKYDEFQADEAELKSYTDNLSKVGVVEFAKWNRGST